MLAGRAIAADVTECTTMAAEPQEHYLPVNAANVHWGYFSQSLEPRLVINSGDVMTVETLTHHANDDASLHG
ncbi:MAG: hypothetical protein ACTS2F_15570 [Thainema sp.]